MVLNLFHRKYVQQQKSETEKQIDVNLIHILGHLPINNVDRTSLIENEVTLTAMTTVNNVQGAHISPWRRCGLCLVDFKSSKDFCRHLRQSHCTKEGGSYVCRYGANNICPSLPLEGVSDMDYENHITRDHAGKHLHGRFSL